jgi:hypothetical protein
MQQSSPPLTPGPPGRVPRGPRGRRGSRVRSRSLRRRRRRHASGRRAARAGARPWKSGRGARGVEAAKASSGCGATADPRWGRRGSVRGVVDRLERDAGDDAGGLRGVGLVAQARPQLAADLLEALALHHSQAVAGGVIVEHGVARRVPGLVGLLEAHRVPPRSSPRTRPWRLIRTCGHDVNDEAACGTSGCRRRHRGLAGAPAARSPRSAAAVPCAGAPPPG